jgi:hypothetical protein
MASEHSYSFLIRNSWNSLNFHALFYVLITSFLGRLAAHTTDFIRHYEFGLSAPSVPQELALNKSKSLYFELGDHDDLRKSKLPPSYVARVHLSTSEPITCT